MQKAVELEPIEGIRLSGEIVAENVSYSCSATDKTRR